jgi:hypothetical protein
VRKTRLLMVGLAVLLVFAMNANAQLGRRGKKAASAPQLPAPVSSAITAAFPGATADEFEQDTDGGITIYSVDISTGALVDVTADGVILEVFYDTDMKQVPAAAATAIEKAGGGAKLDEVQRVEVRAEIDDSGKVVKLEKFETEYSAIFLKDGKEGEVRVAADGTILDPLEWY